MLVDGSALIYQVNDGEINMSTNGRVRDKGALLTNAGPVADQAGLLAASPAAGTFVFWPAGGYIKLGSAPEGEVTVDAYATTPEGNYGVWAASPPSPTTKKTESKNSTAEALLAPRPPRSTS